MTRNSAFPHRVPPMMLDAVRESLEKAYARALGRNPPMSPLRRRYVRSWQVTGDDTAAIAFKPRRPAPLLFGLVSAWNEEDVVWATVRNLIAQGASRVYLLDDESDDATRSEAAAAGAEVIVTRSGGAYDEAIRAQNIRNTVDEISREEAGDLWWLVVDADEFPRGPGRQTLQQFIQGLPPWVEVVGSRVLDHLPDHDRCYEPRTHPILDIPLARWYREPFCQLGHWKHQLFYVRVAGDIAPMNGHHSVEVAGRMYARETADSLLMHHFPLRDRSRTEAKLRSLAEPGSRYSRATEQFTLDRLAHRIDSLDDVYNGRFDCVINTYFSQRRIGVSLAHWFDLVEAAEAFLPTI